MKGNWLMQAADRARNEEMMASFIREKEAIAEQPRPKLYDQQKRAISRDKRRRVYAIIERMVRAGCSSGEIGRQIHADPRYVYSVALAHGWPLKLNSRGAIKRELISEG